MTRQLRSQALRLSVLLAALAAVARADMSDLVFRIQASNASGAGAYEVYSSSGAYDTGTSTYTWNLSSPLTIQDTTSGAPVATLRSATVVVRGQTQIDINLGVDSGSSLTTFLIDGPTLDVNMPAEVSEGRASASFSVTDLDQNFARLVGLGTSGTGAYQAFYNGSTRFTHLVAFVFAGTGATGTGSQSDPPTGYRDIPVTVDQYRAQIGFTLTGFDRASTTTTFGVIPEPTTLGLLALAVLGLLRRR